MQKRKRFSALPENWNKLFLLLAQPDGTEMNGEAFLCVPRREHRTLSTLCSLRSFPINPQLVCSSPGSAANTKTALHRAGRLSVTSSRIGGTLHTCFLCFGSFLFFRFCGIPDKCEVKRRDHIEREQSGNRQASDNAHTAAGTEF